MNTSDQESSSLHTATATAPTTTTLNMLEFQGYNQEDQQIPISTSSPILSWPLPTPAAPSFNHQFFIPSSLPPLPPPQPPPPFIPSLHPFYGDLYAKRASSGLQFAYDDPLGLAAAAGFYNYVGPSSSSPFGNIHAPHDHMGKMTAQEIMDAKAQAASKSHSEAERRRRERINAHLTRLRSLLPNTTKTDKASLLAEVIQHVKELRRQTSEIAEESPLPTETDELTVDPASDDEGRFVVKASLCCSDRSDLLPDLIKALKALHLRTLKAEITTLGGRVKNVLVITGDHVDNFDQNSLAAIQDALKAVMERTSAGDEPPVDGIKRQRTTNLSTIIEHN